jgi:adenylate cyclase
VVFVLNLFFSKLAEALLETNDHFAQFNGDSLLTIYSLSATSEQGCVEAIAGAQAIFWRLGTLLNGRLKTNWQKRDKGWYCHSRR